MRRNFFLALVFSLSAAPLASADPVERFRDPTLPENLPFSSAVRAGDALYISGHIGRVRGTTSLIEGGIEAETRQTLDNIANSLSLAGSSMADVVKCNVYLVDMSEFAAMNAVYAEVFGEQKPARTSAGVRELAWGARVEVECIAYRPQGSDE